jgi:hypothetical protein
MKMSRLISILIIGVGGYYLFQRRYRMLNVILGNSMIRRFFVRSIMNIPAIRNRMMGSIFTSNNHDPQTI